MGYAGFLIISSSSSPTFSLLMILMIMIIQTASGDTDLQFNCSSTSEKYTESSTYKSNLLNVLADLKNNTSPNHGFRNTSYGRDPDRVYGLALCRGDVFSFDCQICQLAIYWREYCYVKYSNVDFFGQIDTDNKFIMVNPNNVSYSVTKNLTAVALGLLSNLSKNATANNHMFATGKAFEPQESVVLCGMVQCSGDLSKHSCSGCLDYAMNQLPKYITENGSAELFSPGARTETGSCC
ncbi:hypothetical protein CASFOL_040925 [Castilleja foliolosa]|uniref:Gnk2-homologous domain-containing protein n=1 Tax=Castilleja foliolosa TaxID=1961234 RepID=A0ABD3BDB2_9LAMI